MRWIKRLKTAWWRWRVNRYECDFCSRRAVAREIVACYLDGRHTVLGCGSHLDQMKIAARELIDCTKGRTRA